MGSHPINAALRFGLELCMAGSLRLALELALFGSAAAALYHTGAKSLAAVLAGLVVFHYAISYDRIGWLFRH